MKPCKVTNWTLPGSDEQAIYGNTHWPHSEAKGTLICCHGFKGYKDYGFIPLLCEQASQAGLISIRFNFSHSGMTNEIERFERPDLFEKDRWSRQIDDLKTVFGTAVPGQPTVVFGHSRGGVTSTLFAGQSPQGSLAGLITAAAPDYSCKMDDLAKDQLRAEERLCSPSGRTGQDLYVGLDWLEEIESAPDCYDPVRAAASVRCPMLIIHGDEDETVPTQCGHNLHQAASPNSELAIIQGANHVFNCNNPQPAETPIEQLTPQTRELVNRSVNFALNCIDRVGA